MESLGTGSVERVWLTRMGADELYSTRLDCGFADFFCAALTVNMGSSHATLAVMKDRRDTRPNCLPTTKYPTWSPSVLGVTRISLHTAAKLHNRARGNHRVSFHRSFTRDSEHRLHRASIRAPNPSAHPTRERRAKGARGKRARDGRKEESNKIPHRWSRRLGRTARARRCWRRPTAAATRPRPRRIARRRRGARGRGTGPAAWWLCASRCQ